MTTEYYAVLGDAVGSRKLAAPRRAALQRILRDRLAAVNRRWRRVIAARFAVTLGDQFQGLLTTADPVWGLTHWLRAELADADWVIACGRGPIATPLARTAPEVDGPCFHRAREALEAAKDEGTLLAFGGMDPALTAFARYYSALHWSWTARQRRAAAVLRVVEPAAAAERLGVGRSAVSHLQGRMSWRMVERADAAFERLLGSQ